MSAETEAPAATPAATPAVPCKQLEDAVNHLMQGKRHLLVKDYSSAVSSLAEACSLIAGKYGDLAPECGDPYFFYGKALLELARAEAGVIEMNAPKSDSDEEEQGDNDNDEDDKDEEMKEEDKEEDKEDTEEDSKDSDEGTKNGEEAGKNGEEKAENGPGTSKSGDEGEEICDGDDNGDDGEVNNLQLAWEVLEMAKLIYQKQADTGSNTKEAKIRLSEVLLKLGEVGIESENWPTAIEDLQACLAMQKEILNEDDRKLAETYYHLAVAHSNNNQFPESIVAFEKACAQLQLRITTLEAKRPDGDAIEKSVIDSEIKELKELLIEMKEKLNDTITEKDEPAPKDDPDDVIKNGSAKPVSSIAHLVRKKPKAETSEDDAGAKADTKAEASEAKTGTKAEASEAKTGTKAEASEAKADTKTSKTEATKADTKASEAKVDTKAEVSETKADTKAEASEAKAEASDTSAEKKTEPTDKTEEETKAGERKRKSVDAADSEDVSTRKKAKVEAES